MIILIRNKERIKHFNSQAAANNYSDNHKNPEELIWDTIEEIHIRTLELLTLHNPIKVIFRVLQISKKEFNKVLNILKNNNLIKNEGRNFMYNQTIYEITPYGEKILNKELGKK